jgi:hypothetical protein
MKLLRRILFLGILLPLAACGGGPSGGGIGSCTTASVVVANLKVFPAEVQLSQGETFQLASQAFNACGFQVTGVQLKWTSSNPQAVSVDEQGRVTGLTGGGSAQVTASVIGGPGGGGRQAAGDATGTTAVFVDAGSPPPLTSFTMVIEPPDPVVAAGGSLQMIAYAVDTQGNRLSTVNFVWNTTHPEIASINTNTGLVQAVVPGVTVISAQATQASSTPMATVTLVVLADNGGPMPPPNISASPSALVLGIGEFRDAHAIVSDALTGEVIATPITWTASVPGVATLSPVSADGDVLRVTGAAPGQTELTAHATVDGVTVDSSAIGVQVLDSTGGASGPWRQVASLPYSGGLYGHGMSAVGDRLFVTGGVTGGLDAGGFLADVSRARVDTDGTLRDAGGAVGWDRSTTPSDPDPAVRVLAACDSDPPCMSILREATGNIPQRVVRYQVSRQAQVSDTEHVYVLGGIDAQVDLGIDPTDPGAVGPDLTRYSDRVLRGTVAADGTLTWAEDTPLPTVLLSGGLTDIAGRTAPAAVRYQNWIYLLGGWGWAWDGQQYVGENHDEVLRAPVDPTTGIVGNWTPVGRLPDPLNKHAATVVLDWLIVSGGSTGADQNSQEAITDAVYIAQLDPFTGDILGGQWRVTTPLPQPLEYHRMVSVPGDPRVVVVGGDNPASQSASADAYLAVLDPATGQLGEWTFLPALPETYGVTSLGAAAVGGSGQTPAFRVYVAGGGSPLASDVTDLQRSSRAYVLDLTDP